MSALHSKFIKFSCVVLIIFSTAFLLFSSCGEAKYKFIDDGVLQAPDGTIYRRYEQAVYFCSTISLGEFLGKLQGYIGTDSKNHDKGIYSLNSDGSDDYIVFVEEEAVGNYKSGQPQRSLWPIYVKDGCELSFRDWDKVVDASLMFVDPEDTPINDFIPYTTYCLKEGYNASDAMKALIGDDYITDYEADRGQCHGYIHYRIEGIDLIDIGCYIQHYERKGWIIQSTDFVRYHVNPEAFRMFEMPERMTDYLQYPIFEEEWLD